MRTIASNILYMEQYRQGGDVRNSAVFASTPGTIVSAPSSTIGDSAIAPWNKAVIYRLQQLSSLQVGWDGFSAAQIRPDIAFFAAQFLSDFMRNDSIPPYIVPLHSGGLQMEWHVANGDIEMSIDEPFNVSIWWRNRITGEEHVIIDVSRLALDPIVALISASDGMPEVAA